MMYKAPPCQSSPTYPLQRPPSLCHSPYCTHELQGVEAKPQYPSSEHICPQNILHLDFAPAHPCTSHYSRAQEFTMIVLLLYLHSLPHQSI